MNKFQSKLQKPFPVKFWNVTYILIGINVGIYLLSLVVNTFAHTPIFSQIFGLSFAGVIGVHPANAPVPGIWQFLTYMFAHDPSGISHILFNMFTLWMFGLPLERRIGSIEYLVFYLVCGLGSGLLHFSIEGIAFGIGAATGNEGALLYSAVPLIGASGAIFSVMVAYAIYYSESMIYLFGLIPLKARNAILIFGGIEILNIFMAFGPGNISNVSNLTHLGGIFAALIYLKVRKNINGFKILIPHRN